MKNYAPPFSNVSECERWFERNCWKCKFSDQQTDSGTVGFDEFRCSIERLILVGYVWDFNDGVEMFGDGIEPLTAIGYLPETGYIPSKCGRFQEKEQ